MKTSRKECESGHRTYVNTNPRYKNFCQSFYTAGDEEQFQESRNFASPIPKSIDLCNPEFNFEIWNGNCDLTGDCVTSTFRYIFNKFKKGIYIKIKNNKLVSFLPFSKAKFFNEWSHKIDIEPKFKNVVEFMRYINAMEGRPFDGKKVNRFTNAWYANNCLVRYEFPLSEGDTGTHHIQNMFEELCAQRYVPDVELFINRRDFPLLKKDYTEPYEHLWDSETHPLVSHKYDKYFPILSSVTKDGFADLPIPTIDDWARVKSADGVHFPKTRTGNYEEDFSTLWDDKKPTAVFRGGSTGFGTTLETNPRLYVAYLSVSTPSDEQGIPYIDAGITDWNLRPRKIKGEKYLKTIDVNSMPFKLVEKLSTQQQSLYKYIIHIDGHVSAFRLSVEMSTGSTLLIVDSDYKLWYKHLLVPYVHYVPIRRDLTDLLEKIKWCRDNDAICKKMAENCKVFFKKYLEKDGIFNYLQSLLVKLSSCMGSYKFGTHPLDLQLDEEYSSGVKIYPFEKKFIHDVFKTRTSTIKEYEAGLILKTTTDSKKKKENIHEAFIGPAEINFLRTQIPHFCKTYGLVEMGDEKSVLSEKINGINMLNWLDSPSFNFDDYISILKQLVLAIEVAQKSCGFVHYDLFPWNVMIQYMESQVTIEYIISHEKVVQIHTRVVPVIIDYGKSHVIHKGVHFGFVNMFNFNFVQDIKSIFISSISHLIKNIHLDSDFILKCLNFFAKDKLASYSDAKKYLVENSSFTNMISSNSSDNRTPIDFYEYLWNADYKFSQSIKSRISCKKIQAYTITDKVYAYYFLQRTSKYSIPKLDLSRCAFIPISVSSNYDIEGFTEEVIYNPANISLLSEYKEKEDWTEYKDILEYILTYRGEHEVAPEDRKQIYKMYGNILCIKTQHAKRYFSNYTTLKKLFMQ